MNFVTEKLYCYTICVQYYHGEGMRMVLGMENHNLRVIRCNFQVFSPPPAARLLCMSGGLASLRWQVHHSYIMLVHLERMKVRTLMLRRPGPPLIHNACAPGAYEGQDLDAEAARSATHT